MLSYLKSMANTLSLFVPFQAICTGTEASLFEHLLPRLMICTNITIATLEIIYTKHCSSKNLLGRIVLHVRCGC
jgi:hypothetical protein